LIALDVAGGFFAVLCLKIYIFTYCLQFYKFRHLYCWN